MHQDPAARPAQALTLVPVAAILVASIRLHFLDVLLNAASRGPTRDPLRRARPQGRGMGWFEHGSTIIVFAPENFEFCDNVVASARIRAGQPLAAKTGLIVAADGVDAEGMKTPGGWNGPNRRAP